MNATLKKVDEHDKNSWMWKKVKNRYMFPEGTQHNDAASVKCVILSKYFDVDTDVCFFYYTTRSMKK